MKKTLFLFSALASAVLLSACAAPAPAGGGAGAGAAAAPGIPALGEQWASGHFFAGPRGGSTVVIGVASRQGIHDWEREAEIGYAKIEAARIISLENARIVSEFNQVIGVGFNDFVLNSDTIVYRGAEYEQFVEMLEFDPGRDVVRHMDGTIVRFSFPRGGPPVGFVGSLGGDGRPNWLNRGNLPEIDGYVFGVGYSRNQDWLRQTVELSAANAAARILASMGADFYARIDDEIEEGTVETIEERFEGVVSGFRVLEFWIEPGRGDVFTLGIARRQ